MMKSKTNCKYKFIENDTITDLELNYHLKILSKLGNKTINSSDKPKKNILATLRF